MHGLVTRRHEVECGRRELGKAGAGTACLAVALRTPNRVDPADGIADSAAEAGQPGCSPFHFSHGALEPGLKAGEGTHH